jgi:hypothetical protein
MDNKDYIVVKTHEETFALTRDYKGKDLQGKYVIVAPDGLEFISKEELMKLPAVLSALQERDEYWKGKFQLLRDDYGDDSQFDELLVDMMEGRV